MKKINVIEMQNIEGGDFWSGLACGIGIGLMVTGVGIGLGAVAVAAGCGSTIFN
jgi:hypothetical protein